MNPRKYDRSFQRVSFICQKNYFFIFDDENWCIITIGRKDTKLGLHESILDFISTSIPVFLCDKSA